MNKIEYLKRERRCCIGNDSQKVIKSMNICMPVWKETLSTKTTDLVNTDVHFQLGLDISDKYDISVNNVRNKMISH